MLFMPVSLNWFIFKLKRWELFSPIIQIVASDFILHLIRFYFSSPTHIPDLQLHRRLRIALHRAPLLRHSLLS
jgi:hypothetical protein